MKIISSVVLGLSLLGATSLFANEGAIIYQKCSGCHGIDASKKALGRSASIKGWDIQKTIDALNGYKNGTYGGPMKGIMVGQAKSLNEDQTKLVAQYIANL
jgi:cytochrome c553